MVKKLRISVKKKVKKTLKRQCSYCGKRIVVAIFTDKTYQGGEYFGKIPIYSRKEWKRITDGATRKGKLLGRTINILKIEGKPYKYVEHWECATCYNKGKD